MDPESPSANSPAEPNRSRRVALGTATGIGAQAIQFACGLVLVPIALSHLGRDGYDLWLTATQASAYVALGDFGVGLALLNGMAAARGTGDLDGGRRLFRTVLVVLAAAGALLGTAGLLLPWLPVEGLLSSPPSAPGAFRGSLCLLVVVAAAALPLSTWTFSAHGLQDSYRVNLWGGLAPVLTLAGASAAFACGGGLVAFAAVAGGAQLAVLFAVVVDQRSRARWIAATRPRTDFALLPGLVRDALPFLAIRVAGTVLTQSQILILASHLPSGEAAPYAIPARFFTAGQAVIQTFFGALWPALADLQARGASERIREVYARVARLSVGLAAGGAAALVVFGRPLLGWWVPTLPYPGTGLLILLACYTTLLPWNFLHNVTSVAQGRQRSLAVVNSIEAAVYVTIALGLVGPLGREGLAAAMLIALVPTAVVLPRVSGRVPGVSPSAAALRALRGLLPALGALGATWAAGCAAASPSDPGRVAAGAAIFTVVLVALTLRGGTSAADRQFVREAIARALGRRREGA